MPIGFGGSILSSRKSILALRTRLISGPWTSMLVVRVRFYKMIDHYKGYLFYIMLY